MTNSTLILDRDYPTTPETVWELWTTAAGISSWWAPDGFTTEVSRLDLRPHGELVYTMTATGPEQVAFMEQAGLPLSTESRKRFTEVVPPRRLAYQSLVDFVPDHEPYEQLTVVEIAPTPDGVHVTMSIEPLHDQTWTDRLVAGRSNELDNLAAVIASRG